MKAAERRLTARVPCRLVYLQEIAQFVGRYADVFENSLERARRDRSTGMYRDGCNAVALRKTNMRAFGADFVPACAVQGAQELISRDHRKSRAHEVKLRCGIDRYSADDDVFGIAGRNGNPIFTSTFDF